jgi:hypothetical protein
MKSPLDSTEPQRVEFRSPVANRVYKIFKATFSTIMLTLFLAMGVVALIMWQWPNQQPDWAIALGALIVLAFVGWMVWVFDRLDATRLILMEYELWIGGRFFGRRASYDDMRLIKLEQPGGAVGKVAQVHLHRTRGGPMTIWLRIADAQDCFAALRSMCGQSPAIGLDAVYGPERDEFAEQARHVLRREFEHRARRSLSAAIMAGVFGAALMGGLAAGGVARGWPLTLVAALFIGMCAAVMRYREQRRLASRVAVGDPVTVLPSTDNGA